MVKVVAFDLDGTLSQSDLFIIPCHRITMEKYGITGITDAQITNLIGGLMEDGRKLLFPKGTMDEYLEYHKKLEKYLPQMVEERGRVYDGIPEMLDQLRDEGYITALCSNGGEAYIDCVLKNLHLKEKFDFIQHQVVGCNKSQLLKRIRDKYQPQGIVMVGDRHFDKTAAKENEVPFIGCAYGLYPDEVTDADFLAHTAKQVLEGVKTLIG